MIATINQWPDDGKKLKSLTYDNGRLSSQASTALLQFEEEDEEDAGLSLKRVS